LDSFQVAEGIERIRRAVTKHGMYSKRARAVRDYYRKLLQSSRETLAAVYGNALRGDGK
jgi:hypothetical protein